MISSIKSFFHWRSSPLGGSLWLNVVIHQRLSSLKGCLPSILSSINSLLPSEIVFNQILSSIKGCLPSKVVFHQWSPSIKGCLQSKVDFHQRSSSIKGCLPAVSVWQGKKSQLRVLGKSLEFDNTNTKPCVCWPVCKQINGGVHAQRGRKDKEQSRKFRQFISRILNYCHNPNGNTTSTQQLSWTGKWLCSTPPTTTTTETQYQPLGAPDEHLLTQT